MKLNVIEYPANAGEYHFQVVEADVGRDKLVVELKDFGSSNGAFKVYGLEMPVGDSFPKPNEDGWYQLADFGTPIVYAEVTTFMHLLYDFISNV